MTLVERHEMIQAWWKALIRLVPVAETAALLDAYTSLTVLYQEQGNVRYAEGLCDGLLRVAAREDRRDERAPVPEPESRSVH